MRLRRSFPPETVHKRKVGFFRFALAAWLSAQLDGEAGERLPRADAAYRELLDAHAVERLVTSFRRDPSEDRARLVLAILLLESWLTSFSRRALRAPQRRRIARAAERLTTPGRPSARRAQREPLSDPGHLVEVD